MDSLTTVANQAIYPIFQQQIEAGAEVLELRVSHSSFANSYESCRRKFELGKLYLHTRDNPRGTIGLAGEVGHTLHTGFQTYMMHKDKGQAFSEMIMRYPIQLNDNPMDLRSVEACYGTLDAMMKIPAIDGYQIATVNTLDGKTVFASEVPFEIRLSGYQLNYMGRPVTVIYVGFIDLIVYDIVTQEYEVIDIKSTRNNAKDKTAMYKNDEQCLPYGLVVSELVGQKINELQVNYLSVYVDALEPDARMYSFKKTDTHLRDWGRTVLFRLKELNEFMNLHWFPRTGSSCMDFKQPCRYFEACHYRTPDGIMSFMQKEDKVDKLIPFEPWIKIDLEIAA